MFDCICLKEIDDATNDDGDDVVCAKVEIVK
jgi:hypothetical protein